MTSHPRRAVVFGGSGFIGAHLLKRLRADGWQALCVDLVAPADTDARHVAADVRQPISLPAEWDGAVVFNLAAVHRTPGHEEREYYETNVWGALNVTQWARQAGSPVVVFTSSIAVYGASEEAKTEASPPMPNIAYGRSKLIAERVHEVWRDEDAERRLVVVRPAVVFGPGEKGNFTRLATALRQRRFVYPGRKDTIKSCGYVADLVEALLFALDEAPDLDLFNFCYAERLTIQAICETFHEVGGFALPAAVPAGPVRWGLNARLPGLSALQARAKKLITSTNIEPDALAKSGFQWTTSLPTALEQWRVDSEGSFR